MVREMKTLVNQCCTASSSLEPMIENDIQIQSADQLAQNNPNPFQHSTNISYTLAKSGLASIKIYNSNGVLIKTLVQEFHQAGTYHIEWNAQDMAQGIYFYSLESNGVEQVRRMIKL